MIWKGNVCQYGFILVEREGSEMIKTKDEIIASIKTRIGEDNSDEAISLLEDVSDTLNDYEDRVSDQTDWKQKYEDNDNQWRSRYKERFMTSSAQEEPDTEDEEETTAPKRFEDLFKSE